MFLSLCVRLFSWLSSSCFSSPWNPLESSRLWQSMPISGTCFACVISCVNFVVDAALLLISRTVQHQVKTPVRKVGKGFSALIKEATDSALLPCHAFFCFSFIYYARYLQSCTFFRRGRLLFQLSQAFFTFSPCSVRWCSLPNFGAKLVLLHWPLWLIQFTFSYMRHIYVGYVAKLSCLLNSSTIGVNMAWLSPVAVTENVIQCIVQ